MSVILLKCFKVLYFTNLFCATKFLKYKSLENFQLYGIEMYFFFFQSSQSSKLESLNDLCENCLCFSKSVMKQLGPMFME